MEQEKRGRSGIVIATGVLLVMLAWNLYRAAVEPHLEHPATPVQTGSRAPGGEQATAGRAFSPQPAASVTISP